MTAEDRPGRSVLPYPHARNDCVGCRERDAELHVLGEEYNPPGKREARYCRRCIGEFLLVQAIPQPGRRSPGDRLAVTVVALPPGEDSW